MTDQSLTLVPTEWLKGIQDGLKELSNKIDGATLIPAPEWVTIAEAARRLEVNRSTIHRWIERGQIEARGAGKLRRVKVR